MHVPLYQVVIVQLWYSKLSLNLLAGSLMSPAGVVHTVLEP